MKKATHTPNRFTTFTPSWRVKGLALFLAVLLFGACEDQLEGVGSRRESRFKVQYREFDIPVTTVRIDSIPSTISSSERLLCGTANDNNFGQATAESIIQLTPSLFSSPKIDLTGKTDFNIISLKLNIIPDYYVYGDSSTATIEYDLYEVLTTEDFLNDKQYYTTSIVEHKPTAIASTSFHFIKDSIKDHRKRYFDGVSTNNRLDTISFSLPINQGEYGDALLDSIKAKGVYWTNPTTKTWELNRTKTDSVFRLVFPGFVLKAKTPAGRVMGFQSTNSYMVLKYSYVSAGKTTNATYFYSVRFPSYSNIAIDRTGTSLSALGVEYQDFNAPDNFCYLQSGAGLYAKLDFSGVRSYFDATPDTLLNVALNGAEIIIDGEPETVREHLQLPLDLTFRVINQNNRFVEVPLNASGYDIAFGQAYYSYPGRQYLDALSDNTSDGAVTLSYSKAATTNRQIYSAWVTSFFNNFLRIPEKYEAINYMAVFPADDNLGYALRGFSFPKDKVKLRVYYTKAL